MPIAARKRVCSAVAVVSAMGLLAAAGPSTALLVAGAHAQVASAGQMTSTVSAGGLTLRSVNVDLPASGQVFPGNTSVQAINNNCLGCHSTEMILTQPVLSPATWREEIGKMQTAYKAPVPEEDVPAIVDYLSSLRVNE